MSERVIINDVGPRDGLQNDPAMMSTDTKIEFIERLIAAGVRRMEAASFVHPIRSSSWGGSAATRSMSPG